MPNLLQTRRIWFSPDGNTSEDWLQLFECLPFLLDLPNWAHLSFRRPVLSFLLGWSRARGRDRSCPLIKVRGLLWGPYIWHPLNLQVFSPKKHSSVSSVFVHTCWQNPPLFVDVIYEIPPYLLYIACLPPLARLDWQIHFPSHQKPTGPLPWWISPALHASTQSHVGWDVVRCSWIFSCSNFPIQHRGANTLITFDMSYVAPFGLKDSWKLHATFAIFHW